MKNYEHLLEDFRKLFGDDTFSAVMDKKVDLLQFEEVSANKANKIDLNSCFSCLESLHQRIEHMSMILVEATKTIIPVKRGTSQDSENWNSKVKKCELLHRQAALTSKWVRDFKVSQTEPGQQDFKKPQQQFTNESA